MAATAACTSPWPVTTITVGAPSIAESLSSTAIPSSPGIRMSSSVQLNWVCSSADRN
jgi:hypothetical protein